MNKLNSFIKYQTDNEIDLYLCRNPKFKTNLIQLFLIRPLTPENVSKTALVPNILYRGSQKYPTSRDFKLRLDELYGAELTVSVIKRGEIQLLNFSLEIVNDNYLPDDEPLMARGIDLVFELITNPIFSEKYFKQERDFIIKEIKSLINDKYNYALQRCYQEMCDKEPYGIYKLGKIEDHKNLQRDEVFSEYQNIIKNCYMLAFVIGDINPAEVYNKINRKSVFEHKQPVSFNKTILKKDVNNVKQVQENLDVKQGKMVLGFRTGITRKDNSYYPLLIYNGILGAFPHSKLFQNVREKASLAYYATSRLETTKGLLIISSGIEFDNFPKTKEIILDQINHIKKGDITNNEFEWTKRSLINRFQSSADSLQGLSGHYLLGLLNESVETIDISIEKLSRVTIEDVIKIGSHIKLDTIYFLNRKVNN